MDKVSFGKLEFDSIRELIASYCSCALGKRLARNMEPVRNADLTRTLARTLGRPALLPVPAFAVRAALGALSTELLGSRRVVPAHASKHGFAFVHPSLETAVAAELVGS